MIKIRPVFTLALALAWTSPAMAQQLLDKTVDVDGVEREYLVYIPSTYDGSSQVPLLFNFHGGAMTRFEMLNLADMRPLAEADTFLLVYPQGLIGKDGVPIWNSEGPYSNGVDEMGFTEAMIDALADDYEVDESRVYACGFSNGGNLIWDLACLLSDRVAAVASVAGNMFQWTYDDCDPSSRTAVLTIHGTADPTYNQYNGLPPFTISLPQTNDYWVQVNGAEATPSIEQVGSSTERYTWAAGEACFSVEHYKVIGGGHEWFGAHGQSDFDSNEVIWNFASQYDLDGLIDCADPILTYCTAKDGLTCGLPSIAFSGLPEAGATSGFTISTSPAPGQRAGLILYSCNGRGAIPFEGGLLCAAPPIRRSTVVGSGGTSGQCDGAFALDWNSFASGALGGNPAPCLSLPGQQVNAQFWGRDSLATGSYLSDGLEFVQQ